MKYIFPLLVLIVLSVAARENPFEAINTSKTAGKATYKKDTRGSFTSVKTQLPSTARILKSVEFHFQNLNGSIESKKINLDRNIDWHDELVVKKLADDLYPSDTPVLSASKKNKIKKITFKDIIIFSLDGKSLQMQTKDKKIRDFLVSNPYKIVVDFKKEISFYTKVYNLKTKYFKSITIGKHSGYYRVAIELDGKYLYSKEKVKEGYIFRLR